MPAHRRPRSLQLLAGAVLLGMLLMLPQAPAAAHAVLISSQPSAGATLDEAPGRVVLEFNEPLERDFGQLQVTGPDGQRLDEAPPSIDGTTAEAPLAAPTAAGEHTVAFRVLSADGHPVEGSFSFEVTEVALEAGPDAAPADPAGEDATPDGADATGSDAAEPGPGAATEPSRAQEPAASRGRGTGLVPVLVVALVLIGALAVFLARREDVPEDPHAGER